MTAPQHSKEAQGGCWYIQEGRKKFQGRIQDVVVLHERLMLKTTFVMYSCSCMQCKPLMTPYHVTSHSSKPKCIIFPYLTTQL
jgi:hypothetical protein